MCLYHDLGEWQTTIENRTARHIQSMTAQALDCSLWVYSRVQVDTQSEIGKPYLLPRFYCFTFAR